MYWNAQNEAHQAPTMNRSFAAIQSEMNVDTAPRLQPLLGSGVMNSKLTTSFLSEFKLIRRVSRVSSRCGVRVSASLRIRFGQCLNCSGG